MSKSKQEFSEEEPKEDFQSFFNSGSESDPEAHPQKTNPQDQIDQDTPRKTKKISKRQKGTKKNKKSEKATELLKFSKEHKLYERAATQVQQIFIEMDTKYSQDTQATDRGKPALSKYSYLLSLAQQLRNTFVANQFLQLGGLGKLERWIGRLPDGTQPSVTLRKGIFDLLLALPMTGEYVAQAENLELMKIIEKHNKSRFRMLRDTASTIVSRWSQIKFNDPLE